MFAVTRVFFCDCGMVGDLVVLWVWVLLEREGGCLRGCFWCLFCLERAMVIC